MKTSVVLITVLVTFTMIQVTFAKRGRNGGRCSYTKGEWSECNTETNKISRTLTLQDGSDAGCKANKEITRTCRPEPGCRYQRSAWSECNENGEKTMTKALKKGNPNTCESSRVKVKRCRRQDGKMRKKGPKYSCHYKPTNKADCDETTGTRIVTLSLKKGESHVCQPNKTVTEPCTVDENACRYSRPPTVSECVDGKRTLTRTLESGPATCQQTQIKEKSCAKKAKGRGRGRGKNGRGRNGDSEQ